MLKTNSFKLLLIGTTCVALSACQTTQDKELVEERTHKINQAMERAARTASMQSYGETSLQNLENRYKRSPNNEKTALAYANALRKADYLNRASLVLGPFARDDNSLLATKNEYIAIQLALGNYGSAEEFAQKIILQDEKNYEAFHYLGIALEAQGLHKEAERSFRKGLDTWQGDPTPIMNNLALNLATQGYIDESLEILEKAKTIAPDRDDVERNYRIISALKETNAPRRNPTITPILPKIKPEKDE